MVFLREVAVSVRLFAGAPELLGGVTVSAVPMVFGAFCGNSDRSSTISCAHTL